MLTNFEEHRNISINNLDLNILNCGIQLRNPNHKFGPIIRRQFILQYITDGYGFYTLADHSYRLQPGDLFFIPPNVINCYRADNSDPYTYYWLGLSGNLVENMMHAIGLSTQSPVIHLKNPTIENIFKELYRTSEQITLASQSKCIGLTHLLFSELLKISPCNNIPLHEAVSPYVSQALIYIQNNFSVDFSIQDLCDWLHLNRSYFSTLFKKTTHLSPWEYLIQYRIHHACRLLKSSELSITEIAISVGFGSVVNFSVRFKQIVHCSPKEYRKQQKRTFE